MVGLDPLGSTQSHKVYYFDLATRPNTFRVSLGNLDLQQGAPVLKLALAEGEVYAGEVCAQFRPTTPFTFMAVQP